MNDRCVPESDAKAEQPVRVHVFVQGRVQGVGYRAFVVRVATRQGLVGGVRNLDDGRVEVEVEGGKSAIEGLLLELKTGPPAARVTRLEVEWREATERFSQFGIWY